MYARILGVLLLVGCAPNYAPPDWLQGDWTSRREANDTAWFEWSFTGDSVFRREFNGSVEIDEVDFATIGHREEQGDGTYAMINPLGDDSRDTFLRTEDPDVVGWRTESPFIFTTSESNLTRMVDTSASSAP